MGQSDVVPGVGTHLEWTAAWHTLWLVVALFVCAAGYQAALVFDVISWGRRGQPAPPGHGILFPTVLVMGVVGIALVVTRAFESLAEATDGRDPSSPPASNDLLAFSWQRRAIVPLVSLAAVAVVVLGYYAPDPYYLNTGGSVADGGTVSRTQIVLAVLLSVAAAVVSYFRPRPGLVLTAVALWLNAATLAHEGYGH
jgi:hypothetical protein